MFDYADMNVSRGTLGTPIAPSDTSPHTLYTVPQGRTARIVQLSVCGLLGADTTFTISIVPFGGSSFDVYHSQTLYSVQGSAFILKGWELESGASVTVSAGIANSIQFGLCGEEIQG